MGGSTPQQGIPVQFANGGVQDAEQCCSAQECHGDGVPLVDGDVATAPVTGTPMYEGAPTGGRFIIQGYKDIWAAVAFLLTVVATIVVFTVHAEEGTLGLPHPKSDGAQHGSTPAPVTSKTRGDPKMWAGTAVGLGLAAGSAMLVLLRAHPQTFIVVSNVVMAAYLCVAALFSIVSGGGLNSLLLVFLAALNILWLYWVRDRIPFASALLSYASDVIFRYKATVAVSLVGTAALAGYLMAVLVTISPWIPDVHETKVHTPHGPRTQRQMVGGHPGLIVLFLFFIYWTVQVVLGVIHVTTCGVAATCYFFDEQSIPKHPTFASFRRATSTSFGSICFGGLIVAVIQTLRTLVQSARDEQGGAVACIVDCILGCLEALMRYFNKWAFAEIAIYGHDFITAAKRCFRLIRTGDGWEGVVSECLVERALALAALLGGVATGMFCGLASNSPSIGVLTGIIGFALCRVMVIAVDSVVIALFVCFAESPEFMERRRPQLYRTFQETIGQWTLRHAQRAQH